MSLSNQLSVSDQITWLEKLINNIQQSVYFGLTLTWAVLAVVVASAGFALYFLSKVWVNKAVEDKLEKIKQDVTNELIEIQRNQIKWARGSAVPKYFKDYELQITIGANNMDIPVMVPNELIVTTATNAAILEYEAEVKKGILIIKLLNYNETIHGETIKWTFKWHVSTEVGRKIF